MYYTMVGTSPAAAMAGVPELCLDHGCQHQARSFEQAAGLDDIKSMLAFGGSLGSPSTAYIYDWNMFADRPAAVDERAHVRTSSSRRCRPRETYNLDGILAEMKASSSASSRRSIAGRDDGEVTKRAGPSARPLCTNQAN